MSKTIHTFKNGRLFWDKYPPVRLLGVEITRRQCAVTKRHDTFLKLLIDGGSIDIDTRDGYNVIWTGESFFVDSPRPVAVRESDGADTPLIVTGGDRA